MPNLSVDILLGEDYHVNYKLGVLRSIEKGTSITFGPSGHRVKAAMVDRSKDFSRMRKSALHSKSHHHSKAKKHKQKVKFGTEGATIRAAHDYHVFPHSVKPILVEGNFAEEKDWVVERSLIANSDNAFFAIPNVIFNSSTPVVPIFKPRYIRKGEVIGTIADPQEFFDSPGSEERWASMQSLALKTASFVRAMIDQDPHCSAYSSRATSSGNTAQGNSQSLMRNHLTSGDPRQWVGPDYLPLLRDGTAYQCRVTPQASQRGGLGHDQTVHQSLRIQWAIRPPLHSSSHSHSHCGRTSACCHPTVRHFPYQKGGH